MLRTVQLVCLLAWVSCGALSPSAAHACPHITTIVITFPGGSTLHAYGLLFAHEMERITGCRTLVRPEPGERGVVSVKNSEPDGNTLLLTPLSVVTLSPLVQEHAPRFDIERDFAPIAIMYADPLVFVVSRSKVLQSVNSWRDYALRVQQNPLAGVYGTPSPLSSPHFCGEHIAHKTGVDLSPSHYKGMGGLINDLLGGFLPAGIILLRDALAHRDSLRILAVSGDTRLAILPDVPTMKELGIGSCPDSVYGIFVRADAHPDVIEKYSNLITSIALSSAMQARVASEGTLPWVIGLSGAREYLRAYRASFQGQPLVLQRLHGR